MESAIVLIGIVLMVLVVWDFKNVISGMYDLD